MSNFTTYEEKGFCELKSEDAVLVRKQYRGGPKASYCCDLLDDAYACDNCPILSDSDDEEEIERKERAVNYFRKRHY